MVSDRTDKTVSPNLVAPLTNSRHPMSAPQRRTVISRDITVCVVGEKDTPDALCHSAARILNSIDGIRAVSAGMAPDSKVPVSSGINRNSDAVLVIEAWIRNQIMADHPHVDPGKILILGVREPDPVLELTPEETRALIQPKMTAVLPLLGGMSPAGGAPGDDVFRLPPCPVDRLRRRRPSARFVMAVSVIVVAISVAGALFVRDTVTVGASVSINKAAERSTVPGSLPAMRRFTAPSRPAPAIRTP